MKKTSTDKIIKSEKISGEKAKEKTRRGNWVTNKTKYFQCRFDRFTRQCVCVCISFSQLLSLRRAVCLTCKSLFIVVTLTFLVRYCHWFACFELSFFSPISPSLLENIETLKRWTCSNLLRKLVFIESLCHVFSTLSVFFFHSLLYIVENKTFCHQQTNGKTQKREMS